MAEDNQHDAGSSVQAIAEQLGVGERKFLHDVANPLAIAFGMLETVVNDGTENGTLNEVQQRRLKKAQDAMQRITDLLRSRRTEIIAAQDAIKDKKAV